MSDTTRGIVLMIASMAGFAVEDFLIKLALDTVPMGQLFLIIGVFGMGFFWMRAAQTGVRVLTSDLLTWPVILRSLGEMLGSLCFVTALAQLPLSTVSAILMATPLLVTMGAALFLGETVGWRRWSAILVGFLGVLLIIQPGMEGFSGYSLFALAGVLGLVVRDLATRASPGHVSSLVLAITGQAALIPSGLFLLAMQGKEVTLDPTSAALITGMIIVSIASYYAIVLAMRLGEISVVAPYRYSRLLFALFLGAVFLNERPDSLMLLGSAIVIASGLYMLYRERRANTR